MFERISNSWQLVKESVAVLQADKELVVFPLISAVCLVIVMITFAVPSFLAGLFDSASDVPIAGYIVGFLFYLTQYFVIFFFNSALVGAVMIRLNGGDPTVSDGLRIASQRLVPILGYALIAATVGLILRTIAERSGTLGQIVVSLVGFVWSVATYLMVPVLVVEKVGPIEGVQRSASLLKKTWGEQIVGNFAVGTIFFLAAFGVIIIGVGLIVAAAATNSGIVIGLVVAVVVMALVLLALLNATLSGIYTAAVYRYAAEGKSGDFFSRDLVENAFRAK